MPMLRDIDLESASTETLTKIIGASEGTVTKLIKAGMPCNQQTKRSKRYFNVPECVQWYVGHEKSKVISEDADDFTALVAQRGEKGATEYYRAQLLKVQLDRENGSIISIEDMQEHLRTLAIEFRKSMQDVAGEVAVAAAGEADAEKIKKIIQDAIDDKLMALKNKFSPDEELDGDN